MHNSTSLQRVYSILILLHLFIIHSVLSHSNHHPRFEHRKVILDAEKHDEQFFSFVTRPDLDAPRWEFEEYDEDAEHSPGYWFVGPYEEVEQEGSSMPWNAPHIYDHRGELVWSGAPVFGGYSVFDFRVTNILGKPMLSLVEPHKERAVIFDETYKIYKEVDLGPEGMSQGGKINDTMLNMHEFTTAENGTKALHLTRNPKVATRENSMAIGYDGNCYVMYDGFTELDVKTWEPTFVWDSEDHIGLDESYVTQKSAEKRCNKEHKPYEFIHLNSIDKFPDGDYLINSRRTYTVYKVSHVDGSIIWRLGGRKSDFDMSTSSLPFGGEHAAMIQDHNETHTVISIFDNASGPGDPHITNSNSRGLVISLDTTNMRGEVIATFNHPKGETHYADGRGNMQMLPDGHAWVCWVKRGRHSEHDNEGKPIMVARFKAEIGNYRSFKHEWIGLPSDPPDVRAAAVEKDGVMYTIVHMSWNGATEIEKWNVYHTNADGTNRTMAGSTKKYGFETAMWTEGYAKYVLVEAMDKNDTTLGESYTFATIPTHDQLSAGNKSNATSGSSGFANPVTIEPIITSPVCTDRVRHDFTLDKIVMTFFAGFLTSVFLGSVLWGVKTSKHRGSLAWWRQTKQSYDPIFEASSRDEGLQLEERDGDTEDSKRLLGDKG